MTGDENNPSTTTSSSALRRKERKNTRQTLIDEKDIQNILDNIRKNPIVFGDIDSRLDDFLRLQQRRLDKLETTVEDVIIELYKFSILEMMLPRIYSLIREHPDHYGHIDEYGDVIGEIEDRVNTTMDLDASQCFEMMVDAMTERKVKRTVLGNDPMDRDSSRATIMAYFQDPRTVASNSIASFDHFILSSVPSMLSNWRPIVYRLNTIKKNMNSFNKKRNKPKSSGKKRPKEEEEEDDNDQEGNDSPVDLNHPSELHPDYMIEEEFDSMGEKAEFLPFWASMNQRTVEMATKQRLADMENITTLDMGDDFIESERDPGAHSKAKIKNGLFDHKAMTGNAICTITLENPSLVIPQSQILVIEGHQRGKSVLSKDQLDNQTTCLMNAKELIRDNSSEIDSLSRLNGVRSTSSKSGARTAVPSAARKGGNPTTEKFVTQKNPFECVGSETYGRDLLMDVKVTISCNKADAETLLQMERDFWSVGNDISAISYTMPQQQLGGDGLIRLTRLHKQVNMGRVPIMTGSELCPYKNDSRFEPYGYFVYNGSVKFAVPREHQAKDQFYISVPKKGPVIEGQSLCRYNGVASDAVSKHVIRMYNNNSMTISFGKMHEVPIITLFVILGAKTPDDIIKYCVPFGDEDSEEERRLLLRTVEKAVLQGCELDKETGEYDQGACARFVGNNLIEGSKYSRFFIDTKSSEEDDASPSHASKRGKKKRGKEEDGSSKKKNSKKREEEERAKSKDYIDDLRRQFMENLGRKHVDYHSFPSIPSQEKVLRLETLGWYVYRMMRVRLGMHEVCDKDHFGNKREQGPGEFLQLVVYRWMKNVEKDLKNRLGKYVMGRIKGSLLTVDQKLLFIGLGDINNNFYTAFMRNSLPDGSIGVIQQHDLFNRLGSFVDSRKSHLELNKSNKSTQPRQVHSSSDGIMCGNTTPEGLTSGLTKHLALGCVISQVSSAEKVVKLFEEEHSNGMEVDEGEGTAHPGYLITVNGMSLIKREFHRGMTGKDVYRFVKKAREEGKLAPDVSACYDKKERAVKIWTDRGRFLSQAFTAEFVRDKEAMHHVCTSLRTKKDWRRELLDKGRLVLIDALERDLECVVAHYPKMVRLEHNEGIYTHSLVHPSLNQSILNAIAPANNLNWSVRLTYSAAMRRQGVDSLGPCWLKLYTSWMAYLMYPQKQLTRTWYHDVVSLDRYPSGQQCMVAVACEGAHNIEDALDFDQAVIDRGLGRNVSLKSYKDTANLSTGLVEFGPPMNKKERSDHTIEEDGLACPGESVSNNGILISKNEIHGTVRIGTTRQSAGKKKKGRTTILGKVETPESDLSRSRGSDSPSLSRSTETGSGMIDRTEITITKKDVSKRLKNPSSADTNVESVCVQSTDEEEDLKRTVTVRTINTNVPEDSDKFCSLHGQKATMGVRKPHSGRPYIGYGPRKGSVPAVIMNPHAFPSRMTISQLIETAFSIGVCRGDTDQEDATSYELEDLDERIERIFTKAGLTYLGSEQMIDGETGRPWRGKLFMGPTTLIRLKHIVSYKVRARDNGAIDPITKAATKGRKVGGGIRFGEMETNCGEANGIAFGLRERLGHQTTTSYKMCMKCCMVETVVPVEQNIQNNVPLNPFNSMLKGSNGELNNSLMMEGLLNGIGEPKYRCVRCDKDPTKEGHIEDFQMPHIWKLLTQELMGMHISSSMHMSLPGKPKDGVQ